MTVCWSCANNKSGHCHRSKASELAGRIDSPDFFCTCMRWKGFGTDGHSQTCMRYKITRYVLYSASDLMVTPSLGVVFEARNTSRKVTLPCHC
jgi:hypothetical protein